MNNFNKIVIALVAIITISISGTVFYIHQKQVGIADQQALKDTLSSKSIDESGVGKVVDVDNDATETNASAKVETPSKPSPTPTKASQSSPASTPTPAPNLSSSVSKHSTKSDCWIIISGSAYNVTSFLNIHPGGVSSITPYCGKDATDAFNSNSIGHSHSSYARSLLPTYFVNISSTNNVTPTPTSTPTPTATPTATPSSSSALNSSVVATHNTQANCWIIISGKIYDVTSFMSIHPGGVSSIRNYCGQDATNAFNSGSAGHNHSSYARSLLPSYYVADLAGFTAGATPTPTNNRTREREWDDD